MIKFNYKKGFTLLEALVATSILMVAVAAPITIAQKGLSSAVYSKNQMIASYLAQDVIEYVKNKRDEISINNGFDWNSLNDFTDCLDANSCQIDTINNDIQPYSGSSKLQKDSNNFYQYLPGNETNFTREIKIERDGDQALITVTVDWGGEGNQVVVKSLMYNY